MTDEKSLCIIPAKGGSKRLPRKNIIDLCGKPMIAYTIEAALGCGVFDKVVVSTEDDEIASVAAEYGASVDRRKEELAGDNATVMDVCHELVERYEKEGKNYNYICILLVTSPLRDAEDVKKAFSKFRESDADSLMSVVEYKKTPLLALEERNGYLVPYFGKKHIAKGARPPKLVVNNGAIFLFRTKAFKREKTYYTPKLIAFKMPREKSVDVDTEYDLKIAEFILSQKKSGVS